MDWKRDWVFFACALFLTACSAVGYWQFKDWQSRLVLTLFMLAYWIVPGALVVNRLRNRKDQ